jgi:hypothetical protein
VRGWGKKSVGRIVRKRKRGQVKTRVRKDYGYAEFRR